MSGLEVWLRGALPRSADVDLIWLARLARLDFPEDFPADVRLTGLTRLLAARTGADLGHVAAVVAGLAAKLPPEADMTEIETMDHHLARCAWLSVEDL
jgi:hypothetical protein